MQMLQLAVIRAHERRRGRATITAACAMAAILTTGTAAGTRSLRAASCTQRGGHFFAGAVYGMMPLVTLGGGFIAGVSMYLLVSAGEEHTEAAPAAPAEAAAARGDATADDRAAPTTEPPAAHRRPPARATYDEAGANDTSLQPGVTGASGVVSGGAGPSSANSSSEPTRE
jgi:hypothetical protein